MHYFLYEKGLYSACFHFKCTETFLWFSKYAEIFDLVRVGQYWQKPLFYFVSCRILGADSFSMAKTFIKLHFDFSTSLFSASYVWHAFKVSNLFEIKVSKLFQDISGVIANTFRLSPHWSIIRNCVVNSHYRPVVRECPQILADQLTLSQLYYRSRFFPSHY